MNETLFPYYERELLFIRQLTQEFSRKYPAAARRLLLEPNRSADPQVERLLESFALLAGRVQHKLDDEYPEISAALLEALYPHYLAPIPSFGIVQFDLDAARAQLPNGFALAANSPLHTEPVDDAACKFRTTYPVTLWPIRLNSAVFQAPPFPRGWSPPQEAQAALRLHFECAGAMKFAELGLDRLRLYLHCDLHAISVLYEILFNHALQVIFRPVEPETGPPLITLPPQACLAQVGFERDEGLLPYAASSRLGYRLLTELFVLPAKFWFVDLKGWDQVRRRGYQRHCEVVIFFDRTHELLEKSIDASSFLQGCTPVVNLFQQTLAPLALQAGRYDYHLIPDATQPRAMEVYAVNRVASHDPSAHVTQEYPPFFSLRHSRPQGADQVYWHTSRSAGPAEKDEGTSTLLHLVNLSFEPQLPGAAALEVDMTCSNRDLPNQLRLAGEAVRFELEAAAPLTRIRSLRPLTPPLRPKPRRGWLWRLISHLSPNFLSLVESGAGLPALREMLELYDFSDPEAGQQQLAAVTRQFLEGVTAVSGRRVIGRLTREGVSSFCRGLQVELELDEDRYPGVGHFLFASVLERFFGLYVSASSFTQLAAKTKQQGEHFKVWPPRPGELPSL